MIQLESGSRGEGTVGAGGADGVSDRKSTVKSVEGSGGNHGALRELQGIGGGSRSAQGHGRGHVAHDLGGQPGSRYRTGCAVRGSRLVATETAVSSGEAWTEAMRLVETVEDEPEMWE